MMLVLLSTSSRTKSALSGLMLVPAFIIGFILTLGGSGGISQLHMISAEATTIYNADVAIEVDYDAYVILGSDETKVMAFLQSTVAVANEAFERQCGITHHFDASKVWIHTSNASDLAAGFTQPNEDTAGGWLLYELMQHWKNAELEPVDRDLVFLWTGKPIANSIRGRARGAYEYCTMRNPSASYAIAHLTAEEVAEEAYKRSLASLMAHEIGHLWGAEHGNEHKTIMISGGIADAHDRKKLVFGPTAEAKIISCRYVTTDLDGRLIFSTTEGCPEDPFSRDPGACGCNFSDRDSDGVYDCEDQCPDNADLQTLGPCVCDSSDADSDGSFDCVDACPFEPNHSEKGPCGCIFSDRDSDGTLDCVDQCPDDGEHHIAGSCGCSFSDEDSDGILDCLDRCPADPIHSEYGPCGCDFSDRDTDGVLDCQDQCPDDEDHHLFGPCGCDFSDTDSDDVLDCIDRCPSDPIKSHPMICGCNVPETDSDGDGWPDCVDWTDDYLWIIESAGNILRREADLSVTQPDFISWRDPATEVLFDDMTFGNGLLWAINTSTSTLWTGTTHSTPQQWNIAGFAPHPRAIAYMQTTLWMLASDGSLWTRPPINSFFQGWDRVPTVSPVIASASIISMTALEDTLWLVVDEDDSNTSYEDRSLWRCNPGTHSEWERIADLHGAVAIMSAGGLLYWGDNQGDLWMRSPVESQLPSTKSGFFESSADILGMTGSADLYDECPEHQGQTKPGNCGCGVTIEDNDSDGIDDCVDCDPSDGSVGNNDCHSCQLSSAVYPGAPEKCDGIRNDCLLDEPWDVPADEDDTDQDGTTECGSDVVLWGLEEAGNFLQRAADSYEDSFSFMEWYDPSQSPLFDDMTFANGILWAVSRETGVLWSRPATPSESLWTHAGRSEGAVALGATNERLWMMRVDGTLFSRPPRGMTFLAWEPSSVASLGATPLALTGIHDQLWLVTDDDRLWVVDPAVDTEWQFVGYLPGAVALTSAAGRFFYADHDNRLWFRNPVKYDVPPYYAGTFLSGVNFVAMASSGSVDECPIHGGETKPGNCGCGEVAVDSDGDGVDDCIDCDANNDHVYPGAPEICDGLDNNCDYVIPESENDSDSDGWSMCGADIFLWAHEADMSLTKRLATTSTLPWEFVRTMTHTFKDMTYANGLLWGVGDPSGDLLYRVPGASNSVGWGVIGPANGLVCIAYADNMLWAISDDGKLWSRPPRGGTLLFWDEVTGFDIPGGTCMAMTGLDGQLWLVTADDKLWVLGTQPMGPSWKEAGTAPGATALTAAAGRLWYSSFVGSSYSLHMRNPVDFDIAWTTVGYTSSVKALASSGKIDECPNDSSMKKPGNCGCNVEAREDDSDGVDDCVDCDPMDAAVGFNSGACWNP